MRLLMGDFKEIQVGKEKGKRNLCIKGDTSHLFMKNLYALQYIASLHMLAWFVNTGVAKAQVVRDWAPLEYRLLTKKKKMESELVAAGEVPGALPRCL